MINILRSLFPILKIIPSLKMITITPSQYRYLCSCLDSFLLPSRSKYVISIDWLHMIRPHHVFLSKYIHLFDSTFYQILSNFIDTAKIFASFVLDLFYSLNSIFLPSLNSFQNDSPDVVFISHLLKPSHFNEPHDFYFGKLP